MTRQARVDASTLVLMDCPGGPRAAEARPRPDRASTLVLMDCPGGRSGDYPIAQVGGLQPLF